MVCATLSPWGDSPTLSNSTHGFTGQRFDTETSLYYFKNRYYSAKIGRFLQPDPIGFDYGTFNLYQYVDEDPLNNHDTFGFGTQVIEAPSSTQGSGSGGSGGSGGSAGGLSTFILPLALLSWLLKILRELKRRELLEEWEQLYKDQLRARNECLENAENDFQREKTKNNEDLAAKRCTWKQWNKRKKELENQRKISKANCLTDYPLPEFPDFLLPPDGVDA